MKLKEKLRRRLLPISSTEKLNLGEEIFYNGTKVGKILIEQPYPIVLLKVIDQTILKQAPVVIYDINIYWGKKEFGKFNVYSSPIDNSSNNILIVMDSNPKKDRIDKKLLHQNAARSVSGLSAMLAHEIRNPLAGISGAAQLLAQNADIEDIKFTKLIYQWQFKQAYFKNLNKTWKIDPNKGGGLIKFYGIHIFYHLLDLLNLKTLPDIVINKAYSIPEKKRVQKFFIY